MELAKINWNKEGYEEYFLYLSELAEEGYREFHAKLIPGSNSRVLGVRVPQMRKLAKEIAKGDGRGFLDYCYTLDKESLSHEEISIIGLVTGCLKLPFGELCERVRRFAAMVNNWAICDVCVSSFKGIKKYTEEYKIEIHRFLQSVNPWEQRVGIIVMLDFYLDSEENARFALKQVNGVKSEEYYVQMAQSWLIATALAKHRDVTIDFIKNEFALSDKVRKMTSRKIKDSYRVEAGDKDIMER